MLIILRGLALVTMAEIAAMLGVSVQTVSAVVRDRPGISPDRRVWVRDLVVRPDDHHLNQQARSLLGARSKTIGVVIPSITYPYCNRPV